MKCIKSTGWAFLLIITSAYTTNVFAQYTVSVNALDGTNGFAITGLNGSDQSGRSVALGDINNDGFYDLIIGASGGDFATSADVGETYVIFGTNNGFAAEFDLTSLNGTNGFIISGFNINEKSGLAVASGDLNGDTIDDVILSGSGGNGFLNRGVVYVIYGSESAFSSTIFLSDIDGSNGFRINGIDPQDAIGSELEIGDVNNDGIVDLLINAISADQPGLLNTGEVYVVFGNNQGFATEFELSDLNASKGYKIVGAARDDFIGDDLATGDVNGDMVNDIIIGVNQANVDGLIDAGAVYVVFGSETTASDSVNLADINGTNGFKLTGATQNFFAGGAVTAADLDDDGFDEVVIGVGSTPAARDTAYVMYGKSSAFAPVTPLTALSDGTGFKIIGLDIQSPAQLQLGNALSDGDFNNDGKDDLVIGAIGFQNTGYAFVMFGNSTLAQTSEFHLSSLDGANGYALKGTGFDDRFGSALAAGDVDNDSVDDLLLGAPLFDIDPNSTAGNNGGESYLVFGGEVTLVSTLEEPDVPEQLQLSQNYPNPFNPVTHIGFSIPKEGRVAVQIYNVLGVQVATLLDERRSAGSYTLTFDATGYSSGMYFYRLNFEGKITTKTMVLLK